MLPPVTGSYWVHFTDKNVQSAADYDAAIARVAAGYTPAAIERRAARATTGELFGYHDIHVDAAYVDSVVSTGVSLRNNSSWLNAISITANANQLAAIEQLSFVDRITPVRGVAQPQRVVGAIEVMDATDIAMTAGFYGTAESQLNQINIVATHNLGFTGAGITIGVLDTGFRTTHEAFNHPGHVLNVIAEKDFVDEPNDMDTSTGVGSPTHGTYILGVMGGYKPDSYVGGAYDASFLLAKTEDTTREVQAEEDDWVAGLQWLEQNGADVVTSSLGYINWYSPSDLDGETAVTTIAADMAAALGLPIVNAAGNGGHPGNNLIAPADGDLVITVGAVNSSGTIANFSSSGPTADGRLKPEVLARGVSTATVSPGSDTGYTAVNGTSLSTPLVASTIALMLQANPNLTVEQVREILFTTADRAENPDIANSTYGYVDHSGVAFISFVGLIVKSN